MNFLSQRNCIIFLLFLISVVLVFHSLILFGIIPYQITWGGRLKSEEEMYLFETISILINLFMLVIFLMKGRFIKRLLSNTWLNRIIMGFAVLFAANTIGNLFAETRLEMIVGGTFTMLSSILCYRIAKDNS